MAHFLADECTFTSTVRLMRDLGFQVQRIQELASSHHGVIVLKMEPDPKKVQAVHRVLRELLRKEQRFERCLFVVDTSKYRKRTKP